MSRVGQEDALIFMKSAVMAHMFCLQSQVPFDGIFPPNFLTFRVNEKMRYFLMLCSVVHQHLTDVMKLVVAQIWKLKIELHATFKNCLSIILTRVPRMQSRQQQCVTSKS